MTASLLITSVQYKLLYCVEHLNGVHLFQRDLDLNIFLLFKFLRLTLSSLDILFAIVKCFWNSNSRYYLILNRYPCYIQTTGDRCTCQWFFVTIPVMKLSISKVPSNIDLVQHWYPCQFIECILNNDTLNLL